MSVSGYTELKKQRKNKKMNNKQILNSDTYDIEGECVFTYNSQSSVHTEKKTPSPLHQQQQNNVSPTTLSTSPITGLSKTKIFELLEKKMMNAKTERQEEFIQLLKDKTKKIILVCGPAGTGKTLLSTQYGIKNFLLGVYDKLVFTRPSISVDENIGFLPGSLEEKMAPWIRPIYDILTQFITHKDVDNCMEEKKIEIAPLGFMRGRTFKNTWIIADEMQNCTIEQMKMLMTRLGENSRLIITGDLEQSDLHRRMNGLDDFLIRFKNKRSNSITHFEFKKDDVQREEVIKEILEIYYSNV